MRFYDWILDAGIVVLVITCLFDASILIDYIYAVVLLLLAVFMREINDAWHPTDDDDTPIKRMIE